MIWKVKRLIFLISFLFKKKNFGIAKSQTKKIYSRWAIMTSNEGFSVIIGTGPFNKIL